MVNKRYQKRKQENEDDREWLDYLNMCDNMLLDEDYEFASDTIQGIRDWIDVNEFVTEKQKEAIENIASSKKE